MKYGPSLMAIIICHSRQGRFAGRPDGAVRTSIVCQSGRAHESRERVIHKQTIPAMCIRRAVRLDISHPLLRITLKLNYGSVQSRVLVDHVFVQIVYGPIGTDVVCL